MEEDGWLNRKIIDYFTDYARICFQRFGNRVKNWITINESWVVAIKGYGQGDFAPGRTSDSEPYLAGHHLILSHASAVRLYKSEFRHQNGQIGITNNCDWREPVDDSPENVEAAERSLLFFLGWFTDPIYLGDYPRVMRDRLGDRLPKFTLEEKSLIMGSSDFFGLNHYSTMYAAYNTDTGKKTEIYGNGGLTEDQDVILSQDSNWPLTTMHWGVVPWGCTKLLLWIRDRYDNPDIYITENGFACEDKLVEGVVDDLDRLTYYKGYLKACHEAIGEGVALKGYFAWSLFDNFEWSSGYAKRFGINYIDYTTLERIPKASAKWFRTMIGDNGWGG